MIPSWKALIFDRHLFHTFLVYQEMIENAQNLSSQSIVAIGTSSGLWAAAKGMTLL